MLGNLVGLAVIAGTCLSQNFQEFVTPGFGPYAITTGPDGALWFTGSSGTIGRMTTAGEFSQFPLPATSFSQAIVSAPDGALWSQIGANQVARITTTGTVIDYPIDDGALVWSMTVGPDGAIWLTDGGIGRVTTAAGFTQFSTGNYAAYGITTGTDGNLWFSATNVTNGGGAIVRMTTGGALTAFALTSGLVIKPGTIATGSDGAVWFAAEATNGSVQGGIGRITTNGEIIMYGITGSSFYSFPAPSVAAGSDGALWFTGDGAIGRITTDGVLTVYPFTGQANQITAGSDGGMWFTDQANQTLWRVAPTASSPTPPAISLITPSTIVVNSPATTLRILGSGLAGVGSSPCLGSPEGVSWNTSTALTIANSSASEVDVTVPANLLTIPGNFPVAVTVNQISNGACVSLTATSVVHVIPTPSGILGVTPGALSFATSTGTLPAAQSIQVTSTSGNLSYAVNVQYTSPATAQWVGVSAPGGNASPSNPGILNISITNPAESFPPGTYTAAINLSSGSQVQTITITLNIGTSLNVPSLMVFGAVSGASVPNGNEDLQPLLVGAVGAPVPFNYTITPQITPTAPSSCSSSNVTPPSREISGWLIINGSPSYGSGVTGQTLVLGIQPAGLQPGTYIDTISFYAQGSFATTTVYLVVEGPQAIFNFSYTNGGASPAVQTTPFLTSGCEVSTTNLTLGYTSDHNWLSAALNPSGGGFVVAMGAAPYGLGPGTYLGAVVVTDTSGEVWVYLCSLTVGTPSKTSTLLSVSPNPAASGQPVTLIAIVTPSSASGTITFYDGTTSLGTLPLSGGAATLSLSFAPGTHALSAAYPGTTIYSSSTSPVVGLQVGPALQSTTTALSAAPLSQTVGNPVTLTATVTPATATGTVTFMDGGTMIGSSNLNGGTATLSISTLVVGNHSLTAGYGGDANDAASASGTVSVTITNPAPPVILTGGIVNAASYATANGAGSAVAPGSLVAIFTQPLATQAASVTTASLPSSLSGVSVTFNGITAPLVQVAPAGANPFVAAQVPFEVLASGQTSATVPVVITVNGTPSAPVMTPIVASAPGIFTLTANGQGNAVLVNLADDSIAAPSGSTPGAHPIPRGQPAFFYVTGLGAMTPAVTDGSGVCPAPNGLCTVNAMPTVSVGGVQAQVSFAGQAAGFPGVMQVNLVIPSNAPTGGSVTLVVTSADGTVTSNIASVAVQ